MKIIERTGELNLDFDRIFNCIENGVVETLINELGHVSRFSIPITGLNECDFEFLEKAISTTTDGTHLLYLVRDNHGNEVGFESKEDSIQTIKLQIPHLIKKICFFYYKETKIQILPKKKESTIKIYKRDPNHVTQTNI